MRAFAVVASLALATLVLRPAAAATADQYVDVALVLAVDVSRSMDEDEQRVQRAGYIAAFRHPEVIDAITSGPYGRIAVTYVEWAGQFFHSIVVPWRVIASKDDALAFADELATTRLVQENATSISSGLLFAWSAFDELRYLSGRRTVDVSGDGPNNDGPPVAPARDKLVADGITINGLPVVIRPSNLFGPDGTIRLEWYYEDCVIGGPGAFLITVNDVSQFEVAIRRKLILEIAARHPQVIPVASVYRPNVDCLIGERLRRPVLPPTEDPFSPLYGQ